MYRVVVKTENSSVYESGSVLVTNRKEEISYHHDLYVAISRYYDEVSSQLAIKKRLHQLDPEDAGLCDIEVKLISVDFDYTCSNNETVLYSCEL